MKLDSRGFRKGRADARPTVPCRLMEGIVFFCLCNIAFSRIRCAAPPSTDGRYRQEGMQGSRLKGLFDMYKRVRSSVLSGECSDVKYTKGFKN